MCIRDSPNLIGVVEITEGLKPDGTLIVNTSQTPDEIRTRLNFPGGTVWCVDATRIAMEEFRRDIPSTLILGVVAKASDIVHLDAIVETTRESLGGKLRSEIVEANVRAVERAYKECVQG